MKTFIVICVLLAVSGMSAAVADLGIPKVNEVQGLSTSTTVVAAGNFNSATSVDLTVSARIPITGIPGSEWTNATEINEFYAANQGATIYQTVYTEDTQNSEAGYVSYDKDLDVSTGNKVSGQNNVQAVKQITYLGVDASSIISNDYLMLDGAGWPDYATTHLICPFTGLAGYGAFCNRVETGSNMNLKVADANTQLADRFIMKSGDPGIAVSNSVSVSSYATDLPSKGSISAYIKGGIKEGGRNSDWAGQQYFYGPFRDLYETMTFSDSTGVSGDISVFSKAMSYSSVLDTSGDQAPVG